MITAITAVHALLPHLAGPPTIPDIGGATAPPGSKGLLLPMQWALWIVTALCILGLVMVGGRMAIAHSHGEWSEHGKKLGSVLAGIVIIGASSGIVAGVLTAINS